MLIVDVRIAVCLHCWGLIISWCVVHGVAVNVALAQGCVLSVRTLAVFVYIPIRANDHCVDRISYVEWRNGMIRVAQCESVILRTWRFDVA